MNIINTSALDYSSNVGIGFTFLPKLNVTISSPNLTINNLVPGGDVVDSNTIAINVSTNIAEGYNLFATVGSNNNNNNGYNTTNLVNTVDNNYTFSSLSSNVSELSSFTNNTWGYSYCVSNCSSASTPDTPNPNWISGDYNNASTGYNGLPLYTDTGIKLVEKADSTNSTVNFKIAARAGSTQPSGEYTNTINFTAVSNTIPTTMLDAFIASGAKMHNGYFKMQDMTPTICKSIDTDGEKGMQLIDARDDKVYWVAKLKDGNCWMTQNLDLDLSHEVALTSETSDIDPESYGKTIYTAETGYSKDSNTGIVSWLPDNTNVNNHANTINIVWKNNSVTIPNWQQSQNEPYSSDSGDKYQYTNTSDFMETFYNSLTECISSNDNDIAGCQHQHLANYYNWPAAVASNDTSSLTADYKDAENSICPKSWRLPMGNINSVSEFRELLLSQDIIGLNTGNSYATDGLNKIRTRPLYLIRAGNIYSNSLIIGRGSNGFYWSSTSSGSGTYTLDFRPNAIYVRSSTSRSGGKPVRCIAD